MSEISLGLDIGTDSVGWAVVDENNENYLESFSENMNKLGEILGENYEEELLDELFSRFCLGK